MTQDQALASQANAWGHASGAQQTLAQLLATGPHTTPQGAIIPRQVVTPQPAATGSVTLSATSATTLVTSDGRLTIDLPASAVTSSDLTAHGGGLTLQVTQLAGPVGGGSSGHVSLGTYRIELLNPQGRVTGFSFHHPLTVSLHYDPSETGGFNESGVALLLESDDPALASGTAVAGSQGPARERVQTTSHGKSHLVSGQTLLAPLTLTGSAIATFNTSAPQATWPTVQDFQTNLNSGSLTYGYPLTLPPGPGGFVPNLNLSYSSASVNENHGVQTDAPWVGEGWSLDLGQISWSQIDENSGCQQHNGNYQVPCNSHNWQNTWTLSAGGIGGPLLPQNINWATGNNAAGFTVINPPQLWYTAPESHAKIYALNCTTQDLQNTAWTHICWRVWLPSGEMMEFGSTNDSVEYYVDGSGLKYIYGWKVDAMVDPHGNQIHISYQQYTATYPGTGTPYVRDAELLYVSYDSPTCQNTSTICPTSGSAPNLWQPLVQVSFVDQSTKPTRLTSADNTCQNWSSNPNTRCDTATDYSGGLPGPQVTNVAVLNDLQVQVRPSGTGTWNLLHSYQLSYEQQSQIVGVYDSISGQLENVAGYLDLTKIQEFGTDWTNNCTTTCTSWPAMTMVYSGSGRNALNGTLNCTTQSGSFPCTDSSVLQERYIEPVYQSHLTIPGGYSQCIAWVNYNGCYTYSYSETFSQRYLVEADNGLGWQETFSWQEGHMNIGGVPSGQSVTSPFGCTGSLNAFPCWEADEQHWSRILLVNRDAKIQRTTAGASQPITVDDHWAYTYTMTSVQPQNAWCVPNVCTVVWDFGNVNDGDYLDYYNSEFRGFQQVHVVQQEIDTGGGACTTACTESVADYFYITTQGWGVWDQNEVTNTPGVGCWNREGSQYLCPTSPYWGSLNMPAGKETEVDEYASDGTTLLKRTLNTYTLNCAPAGDPSTPVPGWDSDGKWWTISPSTTGSPHLLVAELDQDNPIVVCDPQLASQQTILVDGGSVSGAPSTTVTYAYDTNQSYSGSHDYGNVTVVDTTASDGGSVGGSGNDLVQTSDYTINDTITATATSATGTYIVDTPYQQTTRSGSVSGAIQALSQTYYDGATSLTAAPTKGDVTQQSVAYSGSNPYNFLTTKEGYDSYGNLVGILQPNGQTGCTVGSQSYSSCATYDTSSYTAHVTQVTNALGQHTITRTFGSSTSPGYGEWLQSETDANGQTTSYQYDALERLTSITEPGEGTNLLTTQYVYTIWCPATGANIPCAEQDTIQRYDSSTTVTSRTFFDGWGRIAEVRTPADGANDVVHYTTYDAKGQAVFASRSYYVSAYTGSPGSAAYSLPDATQLGTSTVHDALGREIQSTDPAGATMTTSFSQVTGPDGATYQGVQVIDANQHKGLTLVDALGRHRYIESFTGTSTYTLYATTSLAYDFQGHLVTLTQPDGTHQTTYAYDLAGRKTGETDPDLGSTTYVLDADGNVVQQTDARGQTFYLGYDALDRQLWRNTTNSPTGAYVTYTYDGTVPTGVSCSGITPGSNAIGHTTTEQFTSGPSNSFSGAYCYAYDARGQKTGEVDTLAGTTYLPVLYAYNDAGVVLKLTYPTTEYELYNYSAQERLTSITRSARGTTNLLIRLITYNGAAGAAGQPDSYVVGGSGVCSAANSSIICASLSYDADLRLTQETFTHPTSSTPITYYDMARTYDAIGNVTSVTSTMPPYGSTSGGQDNQQFCYDDLNRLTWAGNEGTNPCTGQAVTGTTLSGAGYTAAYQYDSSTRITQSTLTDALASAPQGSYTYDSTHEHAVDAIGSTYTAQYDAAGEMTCRATTSGQTCTSGSQTGATFTYDVEGRLIQWVSGDGATTVKYGYDGEGNRFEMQVTSGGTTTTTTYISNLEEIQVTGGTTSKTVYFYFNGQRVAEDQNTNWYYPLADGLTSTSVVVNYAGIVAAQLYAPYGQVRWSEGTMPTTYGFTGHRSDSATGLDYYNARYYDPTAGRFTSADTVLSGNGADPAGFDRFAYVDDNPTTRLDSDGHCWPLCTMVIGAVIGAAVSAATSVVTQVASGQKVNWHEVAKQAVVGAVSGAISGLAGPEAGPLARAAIDAAASAGGQMVSNALSGKPVMDGVLDATVQGAAMSVGMGALVKVGSGLLKGAGKVFTTVGDDAEGDAGALAGGGCSFTYNTVVATPSGEQEIGTLKVGDTVLAYDPQTKQITVQTVQHVWVNHDNDLVDLTIRTDETGGASDTPKSKVNPDASPLGQSPPQGSGRSQTGQPGEETVHTTANHPFLTLEQGWVQAGQLRPGMHVIHADGHFGVLEAVRIVPRAATMYNLEVSHVHTFEVGLGQWVVHNKCDPALLGKRIGVQGGEQPHHIIPCSCEGEPLLNGFDINSAENGMALPDNPWDAADAGLPYHAGGREDLLPWARSPEKYHPRYTSYMRNLLRNTWDDLGAAGMQNDPLERAKAIRSIINAGRQYIYNQPSGRQLQ